jgi:hypothetical protein
VSLTVLSIAKDRIKRWLKNGVEAGGQMGREAEHAKSNSVLGLASCMCRTLLEKFTGVILLETL